jgi:hypothetical protein
MTKTHEKFVEDARKIHGDKYEYPDKYIKSLTAIDISCKIHGIFKQKPKHHLVGKGCLKCGSTSLKTKENFIEDARKVHGHKYEYPDEYINEKTKMKIICPIHGAFMKTPTGHIHGKQGCTKCSNNGTSNSANTWLNSLNILELRTFESPEGEYRIPKLNWKVDGYDKNTNTVYEFHGVYWHGHPDHKDYKDGEKHPTVNLTWNELYNKTIDRDKKIIELGYNLVVKWGVESERTKKNST